ncbi:MAG TPA: hypothetical protein VJ602_00250, partial [Paludibacter sp.]|nr:hypothetical protein [Paludibacter sp.]
MTDEMSVNSTTITFDGKVSTSEVVSEKPSKETNRFNISPEFQDLITNKIGLKVNFTGFSYNSLPVINHSYETVDGTRFSNVVNYGSQKTTSFNVNSSSWSFGVF